MANKIKKTGKPLVKSANKQTNYYLQERYLSGEMNTEQISFEPDTGSKMYSNNSQESVTKRADLEELELAIVGNVTIKKIIDAIPPERTINLPIEDVNKIYSFCMILLKKNAHLTRLTKIEMFDLITSYINLNEKEEKYFYKNLSIKFKADLLDELTNAKLYKNNRLF
tara:strand:+ start:1740 stop:2243 length:504 start_codon:yes stop_codon:yes gene_type:complete